MTRILLVQENLNVIMYNFHFALLAALGVYLLVSRVVWVLCGGGDRFVLFSILPAFEALLECERSQVRYDRIRDSRHAAKS